MQSANKETATRKQELEALQKRRDVTRSAVAEMTQQLQEAKEKVAKQTEVSSGKKPEHEKTRGKLLAAREEYKVALEKFAEVQKLARY